MSLLGGLGLEAESGSPDEAGVAPVDEVQVPVVPVTPEAPPEESVVIPEGAKNPDAVKALIDAERKTAREANVRAREAEKLLREQQEAALPLEERLANAERKAQEAELNALRVEVGTNLGLSLTLAKRLSGSTAEELAQDASTLIAELGTKPKPPVPGLDGGVKTPPPPAAQDATQVHNHWLGKIIAQKQQGA